MISVNATQATQSNESDLFQYEDSLYQIDYVTIGAGGYELHVIYGVVLPVFVCFGVVCNLVTVSTFRHVNFRCLSTLFVSALLLADTVFLITFVLSTAPSSYLRAWYQHVLPDPTSYWPLLAITQVIVLC